jgi:CheY-like chemotaxis protein
MAGIRVLVVDDDFLNLFLMKRYLSEWNTTVSTAENGLYALEQVKDAAFDIILMDIKMPVMDGLTASREILKLKGNIPIVVVSSNLSPEVIALFANMKIADFVPKPVNADSLYSIVSKYAVRNNGSKN